MFTGNDDSASLFSAIFPSQITGVAAGTGSFSGYFVYQWVECLPSSSTPGLEQASPGRSGSFTIAPALEENNQLLTTFPVFVWMRLRSGMFGGVPVYEFVASPPGMQLTTSYDDGTASVAPTGILAFTKTDFTLSSPQTGTQLVAAKQGTISAVTKVCPIFSQDLVDAHGITVLVGITVETTTFSIPSGAFVSQTCVTNPVTCCPSPPPPPPPPPAVVTVPCCPVPIPQTLHATIGSVVPCPAGPSSAWNGCPAAIPMIYGGSDSWFSTPMTIPGYPNYFRCQEPNPPNPTFTDYIEMTLVLQCSSVAGVPTWTLTVGTTGGPFGGGVSGILPSFASCSPPLFTFNVTAPLGTMHTNYGCRGPFTVTITM